MNPVRIARTQTLLACLLPTGFQTHKRILPRPLFDGRTFAGREGDMAKTWHITDGAVKPKRTTETLKSISYSGLLLITN